MGRCSSKPPRTPGPATRPSSGSSSSTGCASEAAGLRIGDIGRERGHRTITVHRKGEVTTVEAVSPSTSHALDRLLEQRGDVDDAEWLFTTEVEQTVGGKKVKVLTDQQLTRHSVA